MALHGSQKKFDKNGDGRLNTREWQNWYLRTYGLDIEREERQEATQKRADWNDWLGEVVGITHTAVKNILNATYELLKSTQQEIKELAWKAILCQMTTALVESDLWYGSEKTDSGLFVNGQIFYPYRAAACDLAEQSGLCSRKELEKAIMKRQPLFQEEGCLTAERCGTFWQQVIIQLPPYYDELEPEFSGGSVTLQLAPTASPTTESSLHKLLESLFPLGAFFARAIDDDADRRNDRLLGFFTAHWEKLRGEYADPLTFHNGNCLNFARRYPQLKERWTRKELLDMDSVTMLSKLYRTDPTQAITIWRSIAGTEYPLFDPQMAEDFFCELEPVWYDGDTDPELLRPLVEMLREDDGFAQQIFWSAYVDYFQESIIKAAYACDGPALAKHLFELLEENPLPSEEWTEPYFEFAEMMEELSVPEEAPEPVRPRDAGPTEIPDDGTIYHYCQVSFPDIKRTYSYLVGQQELHVGDRVYVPFGREDEEKLGTVVIVGQYLRSTAPYPPERTKKILRKV